MAVRAASCVFVLALAAACGGKTLPIDDDVAPATPTATAAPVSVPSPSPAPTPTTTTPPPPPPRPFKPSFPIVRAAGGPVMQAPRVQPVLFAGDAMANDIAKLLTQLASSSYWHDTATEYGVGKLTIAPAPIVLSTPPPAKMLASEIETWLVGKLTGASPAFGKPDRNTLYEVFFPSTTTITLDGVTPEQGGESCTGWGGYHSEIAAGATPVGYAVIARCGGADELGVTVSHETFEWATDPFTVTAPAYAKVDDAHWAWQRIALGELSDMCTFVDQEYLHLSDIDLAVQRQWSNAASRAGQYPCAPRMGLAQVQAIPRAEDDAVVPDLTSTTGTATLTTKAIRLKPGETKVVDVLVYSDDASLGGIVLRAQSGAAGIFGGPTPSGPSFDYELSRTSANAGEMVQLTIRAPMASSASDLLLTTVEVGSRTLMWPTLVASGTAYTPSSPTGSLGILPEALPRAGAMTGSRWQTSAPNRVRR